jgi:hypothetical protein
MARCRTSYLIKENEMDRHSDEGTTEDRVRERAYRLWEQDDDPKKDPDEYWHTASRQIEAEGSDNPPATPALDQSAKRQIESEDPQEGDGLDGPDGPDDAAAGKPRAKRAR